MTDVEVLQAALGLRAPVVVRGYVDLAEAVRLAPFPRGVNAYGQVANLRRLPVIGVAHAALQPIGESVSLERWNGFRRFPRPWPIASRGAGSADP